MKKSIVLATAVATALTSGVAFAELSANASFTSNYMWRGMTQTSDQAAAQGGLDWSHDSGIYVGTWASNVDFSGVGDGYEMDLYAGFAGEAGDFGYDIGVATYMYPVTPEFNFTEAYLTGSFSMLSVGVYSTIDAAHGNTDGVFDQGDLYVTASVDFAAGGNDISVYAGSYMFDCDGTTATSCGEVDYNHYGVSLSKDSFTFAVDKNDYDETKSGDPSTDNVRVSVSYAFDVEL
jgi:uncharacterized protein (TIGR02001 family)